MNIFPFSTDTKSMFGHLKDSCSEFLCSVLLFHLALTVSQSHGDLKSTSDVNLLFSVLTVTERRVWRWNAVIQVGKLQVCFLRFHLFHDLDTTWRVVGQIIWVQEWTVMIWTNLKKKLHMDRLSVYDIKGIQQELVPTYCHPRCLRD